MTKSFKKEPLSVIQLSGKRIVVDQIKTLAESGSPEWSFAETKSYEIAKILDEAGVKFAWSIVQNAKTKVTTFEVVVGEDDLKSVQALLLKIKKIELMNGRKNKTNIIKI